MVVKTALGLRDERASVETQLALEIRSRKFGFAVAQGANLLEWGSRGFPSGAIGQKVATERLAFLLKLYAPSVVIARRARRVKDEPSANAARVLRQIRRGLQRRSVQFVVLARRDVQEHFVKQGYRTKLEIASVVAERFGELKSRLPRNRKSWEPEPKIMIVFDALATATAFNALRELIVKE